MRLELEGFSSYRDKTVIELGDADYFVLVGPTGAGKSTVIDALCFALYGSVPRYEHKGLVAPVITQGLLQARVRLDFELESKRYSAVRVVRRSGAGATTKEARLECEEVTIAGNADEVSAKVTELIGLSFEHFTKCVVLPQGEFSRFLHDRPKDRQDMVVKLLNLGVYEKMRSAASARAASAKLEMDHIERRLAADFEAATEDSLAAAERRFTRLASLRGELDQVAPKLRELGAQAEEASRAAVEARDWIAALERLETPRDAVALASSIVEAEEAHEIRRRTVGEAVTEVESSVAARAVLGERDPVVEGITAHGARTALGDKLRAARTQEEQTIAEESAARRKREGAKAAHAESVAAEAMARDEHLAQHLALSLKKGEPCPVCLRKVVKPVTPQVAPDLEEARDDLARAAAAFEAADEAWSEAGRRRAAAETLSATLQGQVAELDELLAERPDIEVLEKTLGGIDAADAAIEAARATADAARAEADSIAAALGSLRLREKGAWVEFDAQRDRLAPLRPPPAVKDDLGAAWSALVEWTGGQRNLQREMVADAEARLERATFERDSLVTALERSCLDCEVDVLDGRIEEAVVTALTEAKAAKTSIELGLREKKRLEGELGSTQRDHQIANELALHLSAKPGRFESWIVNEALRRLVEGATDIMKELSGGQYSMTLDGSGNFLVTDHHNADETRMARTLSGGETFLASLALALALSDQLAELATRGAARLDAIFLDEGFGTLDPATLDTVAATVANLASSGRMVGIITHVRELAEQVPLQLRVRKDDRSSRIEVISA